MLEWISKKEKEREANRLSAEAFHWAWSHNILQIKGNQAAYQTKAYAMVGRRMERKTWS